MPTEQFKMQKTKFLILLVTISFCSFSCVKIPTHSTERDIALKIAEHIIKKDSLKIKDYSGEQFLHIVSEKLGKYHFKTYVSLNGVKSKSDDIKTEEIIVEGVKIVIYYSVKADKVNLVGSFFVPDSESWMFLTETIVGQFFMYRVEPVPSNDKTQNMELDEPEF